MKAILKYILIVVGSITLILLFFNLITPLLASKMPNQFAKADLVADSLESVYFKPEVVALGSSLVQTGVDGYELRKYLNNDQVYNLAVPGYRLHDIVGFFPLLPATVKTVIVGVAIDDFAKISKIKYSKIQQDSIFRAHLSTRSNLNKDHFLNNNFKNRASLKAGLQIMIINGLDNDAPGKESQNLIYPYLYPNDRNAELYSRDVTRRNKEGDVMLHGQGINDDFAAQLKRSNIYLKDKKINLIVYISPSSPDITFTNTVQTKNFINQIVNGLDPELNFINTFYSLQVDDFYDGVHPNRIGAKKLSAILAEHIPK